MRNVNVAYDTVVRLVAPALTARMPGCPARTYYPIFVRWKFAYDFEGVGPRWPW